MNEALVKLDNHLAWDGRGQPFYELYPLQVNDTNGEWALWLSYGFTLPSLDHPGGLAVLTANYLEKGAEKICLRHEVDLITNDVVHADQFIQIGDANLSLADANGEITSPVKKSGTLTGKNTIKWELTFEDPVMSSRLYPHRILYKSGYPAMKFLTPRLFGFVTGTVFVNHKKIKLFRDRVMQGHFYGSGQPTDLASASCCHFREDTTAYFEGLSMDWPIGKFKKLVSFFTIHLEGEDYSANSLLKALWQNKSEHDFDSWKASFESKGFRFDVTIRRDPNLTIPLKNVTPQATVHFYESPLADLDIKVFRRRRGIWQEDRLLTAKGMCSFLTASADKHPVVAFGQ